MSLAGSWDPWVAKLPELPSSHIHTSTLHRTPVENGDGTTVFTCEHLLDEQSNFRRTAAFSRKQTHEIRA